MNIFYVCMSFILSLIISTQQFAAAPETIAANLPPFVRTAFAPTSAQLTALRAQGIKSAQLYAPYGQAAATVAQYASTHPNERLELLKGLSDALKISFWNPEFWDQKPKAVDKRYQQLFAPPTPGDGADKLVGEVFELNQTNPHEFGPTVAHVITNTLYAARSNALLQGAIINALSYYLKNVYEANDIVAQHMNALASGNLNDYARAAEYVLGRELPKYLPLKRGLIVNALINNLVTQPAINASAQPTTDNLTPFLQAATAQLSTATTPQEYAAAVRKVIQGLEPSKVHIPYARYKILKLVQDTLLNSSLIAPAKLIEAGAWDPIKEKHQRSCKWYEVDCWVMLGIDKLTETVEENIITPIKENIIIPINEKTRDLAQKLKTVAHTLNCLPNKLTTETKQIIGGTNDACTPFEQVRPTDEVCTETLCDKKICPAGSTCIATRVPTMAEGLTGGAQKIQAKIDSIRATLRKVQQQRDVVKAMNLGHFGFADLDALEATLMKAFNSIEDALLSLVSSDCSSGALCNIKRALESAAQTAKQNSINIESGINQLDHDIHTPTEKRQTVVQNLLDIINLLQGIKL